MHELKKEVAFSNQGFSDRILAYIPGVTPENEGILITLDPKNEMWVVDGGGEHADIDDAKSQAGEMADEKWGGR